MSTMLQDQDLKGTMELTFQHETVLREKRQLELTIEDLTREISTETMINNQLRSDFDRIKRTISENEAKLKEITAKFEEMKKKEHDFKRELAQKEQKYSDLNLKLCIRSLFDSEHERNLKIHIELNYLFSQINYKKYHRNHLLQIIQMEKLSILEMEKEAVNQNIEMEKQRNAIDHQNKLYYHLITRRNEFQSARNELQLKETIAQQNIFSLKETLLKIEQDIRYKVRPSIITGIESVRKVLDTFRQLKGPSEDIVKGYYGLVIENISCDKDFDTAVENIAKESLFYHIVETDKIGTKILNEIKRQKLPGGYTFIPLKRMHKKMVKYPSHVNTIPLITKIHFDSKFERVMKFIFGNMIICQNLDIASSFSRLTEFDYMVLEGDQLSDFITGGYSNPANSILEFHTNRIKIMKEITEREHEIVSMQRELEIKDRQILGLFEEMQKSENRSKAATITFDKLYHNIHLIKERVNIAQQLLSLNNQHLVQHDLDLETMQVTKESLEAELKQKSQTGLLLSEQNQKITLHKDIIKLICENRETNNIRIKYEMEKDKLEKIIRNYLLRRHDDIAYALVNSPLKALHKQLEQNKKDLELINKTEINLNNAVNDMLKKAQEQKQKETEDNKEEEPPTKKQKFC